MTAKQRRVWFISIGITALTILMIVLALSPVWEFFSSPERLRESVREFGWLAPVVVILIHIAQVVAAPIPGQAIDLANGYLFGWWLGSLVSLVGISLGTIIAIGLAKRFGRPLVEKLITPKGVEQIRTYIRRRNQWLFFFLFLLPGTPDDLLCFAIGLTSIPFWRSVVIAILGRMPGVLAAVITGATGQTLNPVTFTLVALAVSVLMGLIVWLTPLAKVMNVPKPKL